MPEPVLREVPYGDSNYRIIRETKAVYVDKTQLIAALENCGTRFPFIIRPRRFGKTLSTNILTAYYDKAAAKDFEYNFSGTWIYEHKTPLAGQYYVLNLEFSGISAGSIQENFITAIRYGFMDFLGRYPIEEAKSLLLRSYASPSQFFDEVMAVIKSVTGQKIFVIIDEYDQFANEILSSDQKTFKQITSHTGFLKNFYSRLKYAADKGPVARIYITGVTSVSLDSLTSGFGIATNLSSDSRFASFFGFTDSELRALIPQVINLERFGKTLDEVMDRMKVLYDGYRFSPYSEATVYNPSMCLYYLSKVAVENQEPINLLDPAFSPDLAKVEGIFSGVPIDVVRGLVEQALKGEPIVIGAVSEVINLNERELSRDDLISLMVYMGYLTYAPGRPLKLVIPNRAVAQQFFEYYFKRLKGLKDSQLFLPTEFDAAFAALAAGDPKPFVKTVSKRFHSENGIHKGLHLRESDFQTALQMAIFFSPHYRARSEVEVRGEEKGFADLVLEPVDDIAQYTYLFELKHLTRKEDSPKAAEEALRAAEIQVARYARSETFASCPRLKRVAVVFAGTELRAISVSD